MSGGTGMRDDATAAACAVTNSAHWLLRVLVIGVASHAVVAHAAAVPENGALTRSVRTGGETWTYRFTVPDGPHPAGLGAMASGSPGGGGGEAVRVGTLVAGRTAESPSSSADGTAADAIDVEAQRAYLVTATGGSGVEVATPMVGQTVYFHLDFRVVGVTGSVDLSRRALLDGQTFCSFTGASMAGDYFTWCTDAWVATAGAHTLRWDLDFDNRIAESNENNNATTATWASGEAGQVDLEAQRAYLRTAAGGQGNEISVPVVGQMVYFHVDFRIIGSGAAVTADRRALLDAQTFCSFAGTSAPGDYFAWCNDGWTATAGSHTLRWDLDFNNSVAESNENNNSASTMWTSAPAGSVDLEAQRAYLNTKAGGAGDEVTTPAVGQTVYFHLDFRVIGPGDAVVADRRALLDGQAFCNFTGTSTPGDYFAWCNDGWAATAGIHTLRWDLDFSNMVAESNEDNNSVSTTWTSGASTCGGDCNGNNEVTVNELIVMDNIALGNANVSTCTAGDANGDGEITVNEIVAAVNRALHGCG